MASPALNDVRRQLQRLLRLPSGKHWIVSCYLKLEPRDRALASPEVRVFERTSEMLRFLLM